MKRDFATLQFQSLVAVLLALVLSISTTTVRADIQWPEYSQGCADEAGPPYDDDEEGTYYHEGSAAYPVLQNGECAGPLKEACNLRPNKKTAYLEGPISCGDKGWYCRIFQEDGWDPENLLGDVNFGQCNSEEAFDDAGYDRDGHCHGSNHDNVYYWWIRDHWFRQYNGRVRCCCGWFDGGTQPLYSGRIANRCDYRRLVTRDEDRDNCRDANEDHGMGYDDIGCNPDFRDQIGKPIPEDDNVCWEINRFGYSERPPPPPVAPPTPPPNNNPPTPPPNNNPPTAPSPPPVKPPSPPPEVKCVNSKRPMYISQTKKKGCNWVKKKKGARCDMDDVHSHCPKTCKKCGYWKCRDSDKEFFVKGEGRLNCDDVMDDPDLCDIKGVTETCRGTCGYCDDEEEE